MKSILAFSLIFGLLPLRVMVIGKRPCLSSRRTAEDEGHLQSMELDGQNQTESGFFSPLGLLLL